MLPGDAGGSILELLARGDVQAILGVASLDLLERALDPILAAGIPCMAVPTFTGKRGNGEFDECWAEDLVRVPFQPDFETSPMSYPRLMQAAAGMFEPAELERLAPRLRGGATLAEANGRGIEAIDPIAGTEAIAHDFLAKGGKRSRPFITLAVYDALMSAKDGAERPGGRQGGLSTAVLRVALSIETFHKASLVHDDIEDDDAFRYGAPTLHRTYGTATAINVGDFLIGLGYRLVSRESATLGPEVVCDILDRLSDAHLKLSQGQGAELLWRDARRKQLSIQEAQEIYALKTAPAFEAALFAGLRLAGPLEQYLEPVSQYARQLGIAFQIQNDLDDWLGDSRNKVLAGGDLLGGRPTVLWALAWEHADERGRQALKSLTESRQKGTETVDAARAIYEAAGVFDRARELIQNHRRRAEKAAQSVQPAELRRLFEYLIGVVLDGLRLPS